MKSRELGDVSKSDFDLPFPVHLGAQFTESSAIFRNVSSRDSLAELP